MTLHLVADDLTGALDSAGAFARSGAPVLVSWSNPCPPRDGDFAFSTETREVTAELALQRATAAAAAAAWSDETLFFKKIDSLLRGHPVLELAAVAGRLRPDRIVLAPAHPTLGRITRNGRQYVQATGGCWTPVALDLPAALRSAGLEHVLLADSESEDELAAIAARGRDGDGRVLWCGSGGLAQALAGVRRPHLAVSPGRMLGLVGTDHAVTAAQVDAVHRRDAGTVVEWRQGESSGELALRLERCLERSANAVLVPRISPSTRDEAATIIAARLHQLLPMLPRPDLLFCSGGETLRVVCDALGATGLSCEGFAAHGVPLSRLVGGRWANIPVLSKSGAFGDADTLADLMRTDPSSSATSAQ